MKWKQKKAQNKDEWHKTEVQKEIPIYIPMTTKSKKKKVLKRY